MSEPTIRLASCRQDGRCPECGEPRHIVQHGLICGCEPCSLWHSVHHLRAMLTEALALLGDCRAVLDRFESCLGAADMEEQAPGSQALLAKIREALQ